MSLEMRYLNEVGDQVNNSEKSIPGRDNSNAKALFFSVDVQEWIERREWEENRSERKRAPWVNSGALYGCNRDTL